MEHQPTTPRVSYGGYVTGFMLSLVLTGTAYAVVTQHLFAGGTLIALIIALAIAQTVAQLIFFLHLGRETRPRWKLLMMLSMLLALSIMVFGSLWIMQNLNYNMTPQDMGNYILRDEGIRYQK